MLITYRTGPLEVGTTYKTYPDGRRTYFAIVDGLRFSDEFETQDEAFAAAKVMAEEE